MDKIELQRQALLVQLKILKELRLLKKNLTKGIHNSYTRIEGQTILMHELDDVKDAVAMVGKICI